MENIQYNGHTIRRALVDGQPMWCARDVCDALGFVGNNPHQHVRRHCKPEHGIFNTVTNSNTKKMTYISSYNVWRLLLCATRSKKAAEPLLAALSPYLGLVDIPQPSAITSNLHTSDYQKLEEAALAEKPKTNNNNNNNKEHHSEIPEVANNEKEICMSEVMKLNFKGTSVSIVDRDGTIWYVAKDVCNALEITKYRDAIATLDADEKGCPVIVDTLGGKQEMAAISESGMYKLVFRSRKELAKEFTRWVTHEVLPCIRKTGMYTTEQAAKELIADPLDKLQEVLDVAKQLRAANAKLQQKVAIQEPIVQAANVILDSDRLTTTTAVAKQLMVSAIALNAFLSARGILYRIGKTGAFVPYAKYQSAGLGKLTVHAYTKSDNTTGTSELWKWTEKGRQFIIQLWHEHHSVQPQLPLND